MKKAYVMLADGFEEVEAITPVDYLRRAGLDVILVAIMGDRAESARKLTVLCDMPLEQAVSLPLPDAVVLPGGANGSKNLAASAELERFVKRMFAEGRLVAAICAAPAVVLEGWKCLSGYRWTGYPGTFPNLSEDRVIADKNLVTSRAAGTAEEFSLVLVEKLCGKEAADTVKKAILAR